MINKQDIISNNIETLLYNYNDYKTKIKSLEKRIENLKNGEQIIALNFDSESVQGTHIFKSDIDKRMDLINNYTKQISKYEQIIDIIDLNLNDLEKDRYFKIIPLKYFEKKTLENIASILKIDVSTVKRNKKRLINKLKNEILPLFL
ncbi:sigma-70 family RNA polymerase sigma factor [Streptobacillus moniliformis]|uniref:sigma-70 family RNA polymerase sigma factor n=1 Tax=Streptobacillus moniliformis TaxID=34105 RepID=UPI0007E4AF22|nr:sigma-70 family RNA polymerase sigma factor [Streptobacillus moniliformis]